MQIIETSGVQIKAWVASGTCSGWRGVSTERNPCAGDPTAAEQHMRARPARRLRRQQAKIRARPLTWGLIANGVAVFRAQVTAREWRHGLAGVLARPAVA